MQVLLANGEKSISGSRELDSDPLRGTKKQFSIVYLVGVESGEDPCDMTEENAMAASGLPILRSFLRGAFLKSKHATEVNSVKGIWEVTCNYDSEVPPEEETVKWWWDSETAEKVVTRDPVTGAHIINPVGEPYIVSSPYSIPILNVERVQDTFDPAVILAYENRCNSTTFYGAPPGCALLSKITDSSAIVDGLAKRRITYTVKFDLSIDYDTGLIVGWGVQILAQGSKFLTPPLIIPTPAGPLAIPAGYVNFVDVNKNPTTGNLNLDGTARDPTLEPLTQYFNRHARANLNDLNLGPY